MQCPPTRPKHDKMRELQGTTGGERWPPLEARRIMALTDPGSKMYCGMTQGLAGCGYVVRSAGLVSLQVNHLKGRFSQIWKR